MVDFPGVPGKMCDWQRVEAMPGAVELLTALGQKYPAYIATAAVESEPQEIARAFERVGLDALLNGYFCRKNIGFTKPDLRFYQTIIKTLELEPHSLTMIGDSLENDILPCLELGMGTVLLNSHREQNVPEEVCVVEDLHHLYRLLQQFWKDAV